MQLHKHKSGNKNGLTDMTALDVHDKSVQLWKATV